MVKYVMWYHECWIGIEFFNHHIPPLEHVVSVSPDRSEMRSTLSSDDPRLYKYANSIACTSDCADAQSDKRIH